MADEEVEPEKEVVKKVTYKGDKTDDFQPGVPVGRNIASEILWPIQATYDPKANTTTVLLTKKAPMDLLNLRESRKGDQ